MEHFYEPALGHGLRHNPLKAIVGPRPIGWISTLGAEGNANLAPYSFFNILNDDPPILGFCSSGEKDTLRNARATREFAWNLVTQELAAAMNATSAPVAPSVDEFVLAGLETAACRVIATPRVAAAKVALECRVADIVALRGADGAPAGGWLVLGEVVGVHINTSLLKDGVFDTFGAGIVLRAGGATDYATVLPESRFDMVRPR